MSKEDIVRLIGFDEAAEVQFKERIIDACEAAMEMVAFCNSKGGMIEMSVRGNLNGRNWKCGKVVEI